MADQQKISARRDAYSVVLFHKSTKIALVNDFTSSPDQLLEILLSEEAGGGTNFSLALRAAQSVMLQNWSTGRFVT
jgi:Mg-chelatase subunit ChlD